MTSITAHVLKIPDIVGPSQRDTIIHRTDDLFQLGIEWERTMGHDHIPFYHIASKSVYFLYEVQTALVAMLRYGFDVHANRTTDDGKRAPMPIALRFLSSVYSEVQSHRHIAQALARSEKYASLGVAKPYDLPRFRPRSFGTLREVPLHQPAKDFLSVPSLPAFRTDHCRVYRAAVISANVAMVNNSEAAVHKFRNGYNMARFDGRNGVRKLLQLCNTICSGLPTDSGDGSRLPDRGACDRLVDELWAVFEAFEASSGLNISNVLVQGFVHLSIADEALQPTLAFGCGAGTFEPARAMFQKLMTSTDRNLSYKTQWRVLPRVKFVRPGGIVANVITIRAGTDASPVYQVVDRQALLQKLFHVLERYRSVWMYGLGRCVDSDRNADLSGPARWRAFQAAVAGKKNEIRSR
jgi:hypothetical protein